MSLSAVDAGIALIQADLDKERAGMGEKVTQVQSLGVKIERLLEGVRSMETTRNELLSEMRQTSALLERSREKMMRCRNEREANAVQREIEELRRLFRERDIETQKLLGLIDEARQDLDKSAAERDEISTQVNLTEGDSTGRVKELEAQLAIERARRQALLVSADKILIRKYDAVRARRGSGISAAADGRCSTCNISLPPMLYQRIQQLAELYQCPSCQRILYFGPMMAESGDAGSGDAGSGDAGSGDAGSGDAGGGTPPGAAADGATPAAS
jgi:predicted  nucleic acid-binding Zn-ribbon protein